MRVRVWLLLVLLVASGISALAQDTTTPESIVTEAVLTEYELSQVYHFCVEDFERVNPYAHLYDGPIAAGTRLTLPADAQPCYDEQVRRLRFIERDDGSTIAQYTDMPVFVTQSRDTLESISQKYNLCLSDLFAVNARQEIVVGRELFIPQDAPPCYDLSTNRRWRYENGRPVATDMATFIVGGAEHYVFDDMNAILLAFNKNVCTEDLAAANPGLYPERPEHSTQLPYGTELFIPNTPPCYATYTSVAGDTIASIARQFNVCAEVFDPSPYYSRTEPLWMTYTLPIGTKVYVRQHEPPCYDAAGQRLRYIERDGTFRVDPARSDLKVYTLTGNESLADISRQFNVCAPDIVAENRMTGLAAGLELFIPNTPPCYDDAGNKRNAPDGTRLVVTQNEWLLKLSQDYNVCLPDLLQLNPAVKDQVENLMERLPFGTEIYIPANNGDTGCYATYLATGDETIYQIAKQYNICAEELLQVNPYLTGAAIKLGEGLRVYLPNQINPCVDDSGMRLMYEQDGLLLSSHRVKVQTITVKDGQSLYDVSVVANVCIPDLQAANPAFKTGAAAGVELIIPDDAKPCYDRPSGHSLIYQDASGQPLAEPQIADAVLYQVQGWEYASSVAAIFNVCYNRILEKNPWMDTGEKTTKIVDGQEVTIYHYGFMLYQGDVVKIPVERPPCYNDYGWRVFYACYDHEVDGTKDYSAEGLTMNPEGNYCYDVFDPTRLIWYNGKSYFLLFRRAMYYDYAVFSAVYDLPYDAIVEANETIKQSIGRWDWQHTLLPCRPQDTCYQVRLALETERPLPPHDYIIHTIQPGESLHSIARQYGKLPLWIAEANHITDPNLIQNYYDLVIPGGVNLWDVGRGLVVLAIVIVGATGLFITMRLVRWRRMSTGKKRKNEIAA